MNCALLKICIDTCGTSRQVVPAACMSAGWIMRPRCGAETHPLTEDQFVYVSSKHRTSREDAAVRRRHHRRRYRPQPEERNKVRRQVLQDQRQNHAGLRLSKRIRASIPRLVPSCDKIILQLIRGPLNGISLGIEFNLAANLRV